jgi:ubiquinone/menaquinone biosynthesis C-methylase UbiE
LESSEKALVAKVGNINPIYVKPNISEKMNFPNNSFDLITCFGVLHHIPNVSYVIKEIYRVTNKIGFVLIREPVVSRGDWRKPRAFLTNKERGIPWDIRKEIIYESGFKIVKETLFGFPVIPRIFK